MLLRIVRFHISIEWVRVVVGMLLIAGAFGVNFLAGAQHIVEAEVPPAEPLLADLLAADSSTAHRVDDAFTSMLETQAVLTSALAAHEDKVAKVERYLNARGSPLAAYADQLVTASENNGLDWRLLASISVVESSGGIHIPAGSYNAWGWAVFTGRKNGAAWNSWPNAINAIAQGIRDGYKRRGLRSPEQMNTRYASDPNWGYKVAREMSRISPYY